MTDGRPLVAISEGFADYGDYYGFGYGRPLLAAGALPVLLPYYEREEDRVDLIERIDGLVLAGGRDIEAWRYGREEPHPKHLPGQPFLDEIDLSFALLAVEEDVPVLGVCRGCQVLNVALGRHPLRGPGGVPRGGEDHPGAKWDEWRALVAATLEGDQRPAHPTHPVVVKPGSLLASHLGESYEVDSYHHQAVKELGTGLEAVAWAPHGTIEAVEMPGFAVLRPRGPMGAARGVAGRRPDVRDLGDVRRRRAQAHGGAGRGRRAVTASIEVTIDAVDGPGAVTFWQAALGYERRSERGPYVVLVPPAGDTRPAVVIQRVDAVTPGKNAVHLDLRVDDVDAEVTRLRALGATVEWTIDETAGGGSRWTTMSDPQGTLFCVCSARS